MERQLIAKPGTSEAKTNDYQPSSLSYEPNFSKNILHSGKLFSNPPGLCPVKLQAKSRIGQPDDIYEQEADRIADQVMRMPEPVLQRKCAKCDEDEKEVLQAKELSGQAQVIHGQDVPPIVHDVLRSPGQPLDPATRAFMEPRFGHDFSKVRVHADEKAAEAARAVNALAYTVGRNVVFGAGQYVPYIDVGQRLLAHELTHVVQQTSRRYLSDNNWKGSSHQRNITLPFIQRQSHRPPLRNPETRGKKVRSSKETAYLTNLAKYLKKQYNKSLPSDRFEAIIVAALKNLSNKKLNDFLWIYQRENGKSFYTDIQELIESKRLSNKIKSKLQNLWPPQKETLNKNHRKQAILIARSLEKKWPAAWVRPSVLAAWLFNDKVWYKLINGDNVSYAKYNLGTGMRVSLFYKPELQEISTWDNGGLEHYLRGIAENIDKQLTFFSEDIGWLSYEMGTRMAGFDVIVGLKQKIREYQKGWEKLGQSTNTLEYIKKKLLLPHVEFMKYLWSEEERKKLSLWDVKINEPVQK